MSIHSNIAIQTKQKPIRMTLTHIFTCSFVRMLAATFRWYRTEYLNIIFFSTRKFYIRAQLNSIRPRKKESKNSFHLISVQCTCLALMHSYTHTQNLYRSFLSILESFIESNLYACKSYRNQISFISRIIQNLPSNLYKISFYLLETNRNMCI